MDAYRSNLPCDNIQLVPTARRIVQRFQSLLPFHSRGKAIEEVIGRLNDGEKEEELLKAVETYAEWLDRTGTSPRYGCSATTFFALAGEWERFREGIMPEIPKERDHRDAGWAKARQAEKDAKANWEAIRQSEVTPEEKEEARQTWLRLRGKSKERK